MDNSLENSVDLKILEKSLEAILTIQMSVNLLSRQVEALRKLNVFTIEEYERKNNK